MNTVTREVRTCNSDGCTSQALLGATADVERVFGYRVSHGNKIPQAKCKECRRKKPPEQPYNAAQGEESYLAAVGALGAIPGLIAPPAGEVVMENCTVDDGVLVAIKPGDPVVYGTADGLKVATTKARSAGATSQLLDSFTAQPIMNPDRAANLIELCTNVRGSREDSIFGLMLKSECSFSELPEMKRQAMPEGRLYGYRRDEDDAADCSLEFRMADFLIAWGFGLREWANKEQANREDITARLKERERKEKEKRKAENEKRKKAGKPARYNDEDDDDE